MYTETDKDGVCVSCCYQLGADASNGMSLNYHSCGTTTLIMEVWVYVHKWYLRFGSTIWRLVCVFVYLGRNEKKNARRESWSVSQNWTSVAKGMTESVCEGKLFLVRFASLWTAASIT